MYLFRFTRLASLCSDMGYHKKSMEQFYVIYNHVQFDCILDISVQPFELMIGTLLHNFACILYIQPGYLTSMENKDYYKLRDILGLKYKYGKFNSFYFLDFLNKHFPQKCSPGIVPPSHLVPFRSSLLSSKEKQEGFIFVGWIPHKDKRNGNVTKENLAKTKLFFGKNVADYCKYNNISSKWTNNNSKLYRLNYPWE